jgi:sugar phosphate permease
MTPNTIPRQRWFRILPFIFFMYMTNMMDRNNIGFGFAGMEKDLGISATYAGLAGGIFAIGYMFLQVHGGLWAERWSAKKLITIAMVSWGVLATLTGFVQNLTQLLIIRFMIGFVEGCILPATVLLLKRWFPLTERGRANSFWMLSIPASAVIMSPLCGYILTVSNWRTMFIIEGLIPIVFAIIWWLNVEDYPAQAKWLSPAEKKYIEDATKEEVKNIQPQASAAIVDVLRNRNVIVLILIWFLTQTGFSGYTIWLPTMIREFTGASNLSVGFIAALPWVAAMIGIIVNSRHSDKTGERKWHVIIPAITATLFLLASTFAAQAGYKTLAVVFLVCCGGFIQSYYGIWWAIPTTFLTAEVLAVTLGLVNALGNVGGFFGPFLFGFFKTLTNSNMGGMLFLVTASILAPLLLLLLRPEEQKTNTTATTIAVDK